MEEILTRYPHIFITILCNLDSKTMANCRLVNKVFQHCIDNERLLWIRIIERYFGDQIEYHDTWKKILDKATFNITKRIGLAVLKFFQKLSKYNRRPHNRWTLLHVVAEQGSLDLCKYVEGESKKWGIN